MRPQTLDKSDISEWVFTPGLEIADTAVLCPSRYFKPFLDSSESRVSVCTFRGATKQYLAFDVSSGRDGTSATP